MPGVGRLGRVGGTTRGPLMRIIWNMRVHRGRVVGSHKLRSRRGSTVPSIKRGCPRGRWPILLVRHIYRKTRTIQMVWDSIRAIWIEWHGDAGGQLKTDGARQLYQRMLLRRRWYHRAVWASIGLECRLHQGQPCAMSRCLGCTERRPARAAGQQGRNAFHSQATSVFAAADPSGEGLKVSRGRAIRY